MSQSGEAKSELGKRAEAKKRKWLLNSAEWGTVLGFEPSTAVWNYSDVFP